MDPVQMRERAPGARALGRARLGGWRLTFTRDSPGRGDGVPHIERAPDEEVWGVLWDVTSSDLEALDEYEGIAAGAYVRDRTTVVHDGNDVGALVYLAVARGYEVPSKRFVAGVGRGAGAHGVPDPGVGRFRGLGGELA